MEIALPYSRTIHTQKEQGPSASWTDQVATQLASFTYHSQTQSLRSSLATPHDTSQDPCRPITKTTTRRRRKRTVQQYQNLRTTYESRTHAKEKTIEPAQIDGSCDHAVDGLRYPFSITFGTAGSGIPGRRRLGSERCVIRRLSGTTSWRLRTSDRTECARRPESVRRSSLLHCSP
jgi:hypothetical protein